MLGLSLYVFCIKLTHEYEVFGVKELFLKDRCVVLLTHFPSEGKCVFALIFGRYTLTWICLKTK